MKRPRLLANRKRAPVRKEAREKAIDLDDRKACFDRARYNRRSCVRSVSALVQAGLIVCDEKGIRAPYDSIQATVSLGA